MSMLVNRTPLDDITLAAIRLHCDTLEFVIDTIPAHELDDEDRELLDSLLVEGEPADGITLHGTRYGRAWCAYRTV